MKPNPGNKSTYFQNCVRSAMFVMQNSWSMLDDNTKALYNNFNTYRPTIASLLYPRQLSGHSLYLKYNMLRYLSDLTICNSFTFSPLGAKFECVSLHRYMSQLIMITQYDMDPTLNWAFVRFSRPVIFPSKKYYNSLRQIHVPALQGSSWDVGPQYQFVFGFLPTVGDHVYIEMTTFSCLCPIIYKKIISLVEVTDL